MLAPFYEGVRVRLDLGGAGILVGAGALLTVVAVMIPVLARLRIPVAAALSAV